MTERRITSSGHKFYEFFQWSLGDHHPQVLTTIRFDFHEVTGKNVPENEVGVGVKRVMRGEMRWGLDEGRGGH